MMSKTRLIKERNIHMKRMKKWLCMLAATVLSMLGLTSLAGAASPMLANPFTNDVMMNWLPILLIVMVICVVAALVCLIVFRKKK